MTDLGDPGPATIRNTVWKRAPQLPVLGVKEVHIWRASLEASKSRIALLEGTLSPDERQRAGKYRFEKDRNHFVVARGLLRRVLARYLETDPGQLIFSYAANGKPSLVTKAHRKRIRFNVSHSHQLALFAVTRDRDVGVDIEQMRTDLAVEPLAERFFSPQELATLQSLPIDQMRAGFFTCWTRKEAYIKAVGTGLSLLLNQFAVSLTCDQPAILLHGPNPEEAARWSIWELPIDSGYKAALAVEGHDVQLRYWKPD